MGGGGQPGRDPGADAGLRGGHVSLIQPSEMATTGTSTVESRARQSKLFRASGTLYGRSQDPTPRSILRATSRRRHPEHHRAACDDPSHEGAHVRCALNVPNYETAKMILADAADRGARPHDLRPGADTDSPANASCSRWHAPGACSDQADISNEG